MNGTNDRRERRASPNCRRPHFLKGLLIAFLSLAFACGNARNNDTNENSDKPEDETIVHPSFFTVGGMTRGLEGAGLVLALLPPADAQTVSIASDGPFAFAQQLEDGKSYAVTIETLPVNPMQTCTLANASGTVSGDEVTDVEVACQTLTFNVGGAIAGLEGAGLVLSLNDSAQSITLNRDDAFFTFPEPLLDGSPYAVTVAAVPEDPRQNCTISNGAASVDSGHVTGIDVVCTTRITPACFTGGEVPQLDLSGPVTNWTWNDPHVLKQGPGEYWMYASATDFFAYPVRLYRLTSTNATDWTLNPDVPADQGILPDAEPGTWDAGGLETPAVVFFKDQYHLFYTAYRYPIGSTEHTVFNFRIGHAVSDDGISFTRASTEPVVAPVGDGFGMSNAWYAYVVGEPGPVVFNGELHLYFTALGIDFDLSTTAQVIGVVRSADGISWSEPELALRPAQALYPRDADWVGYSTPNAIVLDNRVDLFFDVAHQPAEGDWKQLKLHHARSTDGVSGWHQDAEPLRSAGDFSWALGEIRSPHALLDGSTLRLYFAGHKLDAEPYHFGIGMMTCELGPD